MSTTYTPPAHLDFDIGGSAGLLTITKLPDGRPGEVLLTVSKQGSTLAGLRATLSTMTSLALQYQVPLVEVVRRLIDMRFEPFGLTGHPDVSTCTSLADYLGRRLAADYLTEPDRVQLGLDRRIASLNKSTNPGQQMSDVGISRQEVAGG